MFNCFQNLRFNFYRYKYKKLIFNKDIFDFNHNRYKFKNHHPVLKNFSNKPKKSTLFTKNGFYDFLGIFHDKEYLGYGITDELINNNSKDKNLLVDDEYFEWISNLMSAKQAKNTFVMYELGAGYGRWGVRAYKAARLKKIENIKINFVEAETSHLRYLRKHLKINGLKKENYKIIDKALSDSSEPSFLYIKGPSNSDNYSNPATWYGQCLIHDYEKDSKKLKKINRKYNNQQVFITPSNWEVVEINKINAVDLFNEKIIDLINFDIQGEELKILEHIIEKLNKNTKRLHISTHSKKIHKKIEKLLKTNNWTEIYNFKLLQGNNTPIGKIEFGDGLLVFINPRFNQLYG